jgi:uncharacterized protein
MPSSTSSVSWRWVAVFYAVAIVVALPVNLGWTEQWIRAHFSGTPLVLWPFLPAAIGPALGAAIARRFDAGTIRATSLFGQPLGKNCVAALLPVCVFGVLGGRAALYAFVAVVYSVGEEVGWRGYLADALLPLGLHRRYLLTAVLWSVWHLRFATSFDLFIFPVILLAASFALGHAARETRSVVVPAAMHALIILLTATGSPSQPMLLAGAATFGGWLLLGALWPEPRPFCRQPNNVD